MPQLGYLDTVAKDSTFGSWGTPLVSSANQHAAIPSLHLAWALWVSVVLAWLARGIAVQIVSGLHVTVTFLVIVATANHFVVDAIAAIPFVWAAVAVVGWRRSSSRPTPMSSADAFFLHVETDSAPQHGGMVVLAPSGPDVPPLAEIRALVRDELLNMPRFRQRPNSRRCGVAGGGSTSTPETWTGSGMSASGPPHRAAQTTTLNPRQSRCAARSPT
jgi:diacylglycerol O-acyltransferase